MEHFPNFCTFEIASLVNVQGHYLRKYGIKIYCLTKPPKNHQTFKKPVTLNSKQFSLMQNFSANKIVLHKPQIFVLTSYLFGYTYVHRI